MMGTSVTAGAGGELHRAPDQSILAGLQKILNQGTNELLQVLFQDGYVTERGGEKSQKHTRSQLMHLKQKPPRPAIPNSKLPWYQGTRREFPLAVFSPLGVLLNFSSGEFLKFNSRTGACPVCGRRSWRSQVAKCRTRKTLDWNSPLP